MIFFCLKYVDTKTTQASRLYRFSFATELQDLVIAEHYLLETN